MSPQSRSRGSSSARSKAGDEDTARALHLRGTREDLVDPVQPRSISLDAGPIPMSDVDDQAPRSEPGHEPEPPPVRCPPPSAPSRSTHGAYQTDMTSVSL